MELLETAWKGFRNLKPRRQKWRSGLNVLLGPNGSGKTNLLESLNVLCGWGPFAGSKTRATVAWDEPGERAFLAAWADGERSLEAQVLLSSRATLRVGNERVTHSELRSLLPALSFLPRDIDLIDGSPSGRRLFLDKLCVLCSPLYARRLAEYRQLVRHRTALLKKGRPVRPTALPLARFGGWIWDCRRETVGLLAEELQRQEALLPRPAELSLESRVACGGSGESDLAAALEAHLERERYACFPLVGPHRDDLGIFCDGRPASVCLSRGQKRRTVMALILAAGQLIESRVRVKPILLLDDIAAELDLHGREALGNALEASNWQVFITGVDNPFPTTRSMAWHISEGQILN